MSIYDPTSKEWLMMVDEVVRVLVDSGHSLTTSGIKISDLLK